MSSGSHFRSCLALILLAPALGQEEASIRVDVDLVSVLCIVRDQRGALVNRLTHDDFIIVEEGKPQTVRNFARETDLPLTVGLLVDTSNSQVRLIDGEMRAASQFFGQVIRPRDSAFLMSFDAATKVVMDHASSQAAIKAGLETLRQNAPHYRKGGTGRP